MMQPVTQIVHLKSSRSGRVYRVVALDPVAKVATLRGLHGSFEETWDPQRLKAFGYERIAGPFEGMIEDSHA